MDSGLKWTEVDWGGRRWTEVDGGGLKWTEVDGGGRRWTEVDGGGRRWTEVDGGGRRWTEVDKVDGFPRQGESHRSHASHRSHGEAVAAAPTSSIVLPCKSLVKTVDLSGTMGDTECVEAVDYCEHGGPQWREYNGRRIEN